MACIDRDQAVADEVPWSEKLTAYDEGHLVVYVRLLDAAAAGASCGEMARIVLGIDSAKEPERARRVLEAHLARARWMTETGYRLLLDT